MNTECMANIVKTRTLSFSSMGNACFPEHPTKPFIDCLFSALITITLYKEIVFHVLNNMQRIPILSTYLRQRVCERDHPFLSVFTLPYDKIPIIKVYVLYFQRSRFTNTDSGSVQHA